MPSWESRRDESVDDFDDYDPTPYSGGYDQALTYGRPLPTSDETCHSLSGSHQYSSGNSRSGHGGRRPERYEEGQHGSGYGGERYGGSDYHRRDEGYGNQSYGGDEYQRRDDKGSKYGRNEDEGIGRHEYGIEKRRSEGVGYGAEDGEYGRFNQSEYGGRISSNRQEYGDEECNEYGRSSSHGGEGDEEYGRAKYGSESYDCKENKHGYRPHGRNYDED